MNKKVVNAIVSAIADPLLRRAAERFTASIPENSWLRSEVAERMIAALKGLAEAYKGSGVSGVVVEKTTDFFDFASSSLFKKQKESATNIAQSWIQKFWAEAQKTLAETPAEKLEEVRQKLLEDFQIRKEIFQIVLEAEKEYQQPKEQIRNNPINWVEFDQKAADWVESHRPAWIKRRPRRTS